MQLSVVIDQFKTISFKVGVYYFPEYAWPVKRIALVAPTAPPSSIPRKSFQSI
jgi:hypothetical protein